MENQAETTETKTETLIVKHQTKDYIIFFVLMVLAFTLAMYISSKVI